jgi:Glyoxalase-like domain
MSDAPSDLVIDHVLVAVDDLDATAEWLWSEHGLATAEGGRHVDMGTANRLVPLGAAYLELLVIDDDSDDVANPFFRDRLREVLGDGGPPRPFAYVLRGEHDGAFEEAAKSLDQKPFEMQRKRSDGAMLTWRLVGMQEALTTGSTPGLIEWQPGDNPGRIPVEHKVPTIGITDLEIRGAGAELPDWLKPNQGLNLRPVDGEPHGPGQITIGLEDGSDVVLRDPWSRS